MDDHCNTDAKENECDADLEILQNNQSTKCPLLQKRMRWPMMSTKCKHRFECYAIIDYILNKKTNIYYFADIECPSCKSLITLDDLMSDYKMLSVLRDLPAENDSDSDNEHEEEEEVIERADNVSSGIVDLCSSSDSDGVCETPSESDDLLQPVSESVPSSQSYPMTIPPLIPLDDRDASTEYYSEDEQ